MSARQVELVVRRDGHPERRMVLTPGSLVLGRAEDNDIVLSEIGVSRRHARITLVADGTVTVEDLGSGNGTWLNGRRVTQQVVADGDEVVVDPFTLGFYFAAGDTTAEVTGGGDATSLLGTQRPPTARLELVSNHKMAARSFDLPPGTTRTLGRSERADIVLPEPAASRLHVDIGETAGSWWLHDRGSANGTSVNGTRVREKVLVDGDRIRIGSVELRFVAPSAPASDEHPDHTEAFDGVMFTTAMPPSAADAAPRPAAADRAVPPPPPLPVPASPASRALAASPTLIGPDGPPPRARPTTPSPPPAPVAAPPRASASVPPPPVLPFAPRPLARPTPATVAPPPPPPPPTSAVEIDFDVDRVKARKGPKGRAVRKGGGGFLSRPINQLSLGILGIAMFLVGGRMVFDLGRAILTATGSDAEEATAAPAGAVTAGGSPLASAGLPAAAAPPPAAPVGLPDGGSAVPAASIVAPATPAVGGAPPPAALPTVAPPVPTAAPGVPPASVTGPPPAVAPSARVPLDPARKEEVAALMAEGMQLFTQGRQFEAAAQFYKVQQLDPGNPDAERMGYVACEFIAMQSMYEGLQARSASAAERAAARTTALSAVAAAMTDASGIPAARAALQAALALSPDDPELQAAGAQLESRHSAVARGAAQRKEQAKQASLATLLADGQREFDRGNLTKAVSIWSGVLDADPTRASPQYYQAEEGIRAARDKMKADSKQSYAAGLAALKDGDLLTARKQLSQTVRTDPYNDAAAARLADTRKRLKEQASELYKEARVLEDINQVAKALALYQKVLNYVDDPSDPLATKAQSRINALVQ